MERVTLNLSKSDVDIILRTLKEKYLGSKKEEWVEPGYDENGGSRNGYMKSTETKESKKLKSVIDFMNRQMDNNGLYNKENRCCVIKTGKYKDTAYHITTIGMHPCAYVECDEGFLEDHKDPEWGDIEDIHVHGGVTFTGKLSNLIAFNGVSTGEKSAFGWDYGHYGDWVGYLSDEVNEISDNRMWTLPEIEQECRNAIDQYLKIK